MVCHVGQEAAERHRDELTEMQVEKSRHAVRHAALSQSCRDRGVLIVHLWGEQAASSAAAEAAAAAAVRQRREAEQTVRELTAELEDQVPPHRQLCWVGAAQ